MNPHPIQPGELQAYLEGAELPHVAQALAASPALRQELATLRRQTQALQRFFGGLAIPDPQELVDVATGLATAEQHLRVMAYVRASPQGRADFTNLLALQAPPQPKRALLPNVLALPQALAAGVRSLEPTSADQSFYASALAAQIVVRVPPPAGDHWRIEGYVIQQDQPAPAVRVTLRSDQFRPRPRLTDAEGFFAFTRLPAGHYLLQALFPQGRLLLPPLRLGEA
ncbi:MAG: carboxypeptidase regulatory-like domain-containing protein [Candidatus Viridilinea halotolerans]|uniref:Carboxypeptidase regulatory-like domain-containing protein n=1 Tax=Candidatus Viridilinea halotolerans TaxID=2491704 RepID=A0A426U476_9CHLR|nr:MAG: carboxypeptidase regulatory-like domain-containing protein [Candidatus Viridilinea halotolerans]